MWCHQVVEFGEESDGAPQVAEITARFGRLASTGIRSLAGSSASWSTARAPAVLLLWTPKATELIIGDREVGEIFFVAGLTESSRLLRMSMPKKL
jgi:hypothetical protein